MNRWMDELEGFGRIGLHRMFRTSTSLPTEGMYEVKAPYLLKTM